MRFWARFDSSTGPRKINIIQLSRQNVAKNLLPLWRAKWLIYGDY
jgi:hypothetical protein